MATAAQIAEWKARPLPFCITRYDGNLGRSVPAGKRRYATAEGATRVAARRDKGKLTLLVDYAGAFEQAA